MVPEIFDSEDRLVSIGGLDVKPVFPDAFGLPIIRGQHWHWSALGPQDIVDNGFCQHHIMGGWWLCSQFARVAQHRSLAARTDLTAGQGTLRSATSCAPATRTSRNGRRCSWRVVAGTAGLHGVHALCSGTFESSMGTPTLGERAGPSQKHK